MPSEYDRLVETGAIASLKRDILLEASDELFYLVHIRRWFAETAGAEAAKVATACTVRVIRELSQKNLCHLATWGEEKGSFKAVEMEDDELSQLVERYKSFDAMPFDYFLIATEIGKGWVAQYRALAKEL